MVIGHAGAATVQNAQIEVNREPDGLDARQRENLDRRRLAVRERQAA